MKFRIKYADQIVGLFVIIAFVLLALLLVVMGGRQRWFEKDYHYYSRFPSSTGLSVGTNILYKGFQIGRIQEVVLNEDEEVDVSVIIYDQYIQQVKEYSLLELVISPIGLGTQLLFYPGTSDKNLPENSFIPSLESEEGQRLVAAGLVDRPPKDDTISRLLSNVNPLIENINAVVTQLEQTLSSTNAVIEGRGTGPLADTLANVGTMSSQMSDTLVTSGPAIERMIADLEDVVASVALITANLEQTSEALRDPTGLVPKLLDPKGSLKTLLDDGDVLFNSIYASLLHVEQSLANVETTSASLSNEMPRIAATLEEARAAIVSAQDVMEGLKNNPLLRGGIPERVNPQAAPTSLRTADF